MLLHIHDGRRRRWEACDSSKIPGRVPASAKGQFHDLAGCPDAELSSHSHPIPDRESLSSDSLSRHKLTIATALRLLCRYCLDRLSLPDQFRRRSLSVLAHRVSDINVYGASGS